MNSEERLGYESCTHISDRQTTQKNMERSSLKRLLPNRRQNQCTSHSLSTSFKPQGMKKLSGEHVVLFIMPYFCRYKDPLK